MAFSFRTEGRYEASPLPQGYLRPITAVIGSDIARQVEPATPSPDGAGARCAWHARKIHDALRSRPSPKRSNGRARCYRSVHIGFKLQWRQARRLSGPSPLAYLGGWDEKAGEDAETQMAHLPRQRRAGLD
jgi:hypothetical protein